MLSFEKGQIENITFGGKQCYLTIEADTAFGQPISEEMCLTYDSFKRHQDEILEDTYDSIKSFFGNNINNQNKPFDLFDYIRMPFTLRIQQSNVARVVELCCDCISDKWEYLVVSFKNEHVVSVQRKSFHEYTDERWKRSRANKIQNHTDDVHACQPAKVITTRTREQEILYINALQDKYVNDLIAIIENDLNGYQVIKETNLTSPTGTGKTHMIAKMIDKRPDWFFVISSLSRGSLVDQIKAKLLQECTLNNYLVIGSQQLTVCSKLTAESLLSMLPNDKPIIWIRDEGHIHTNRLYPVLDGKAAKIVNVSATNINCEGVVCNFSDTMMLRTVIQKEDATIADALDKLMEIKREHSIVPNYNPCAILRLINQNEIKKAITECKVRGLTYKTLIDTRNDDIRALCEDDCPVDVIFHKMKLTEGIDIRRAHVLYMNNEPNKASTTIQAIGRCRRNALLWRDDVDILSVNNRSLLSQTRFCYVFYSQAKRIHTDENNELVQEFCPYISVERLRPNIDITVVNGMLPNGLSILELDGQTGSFHISVDTNTGFNIVDRADDFYATKHFLINHGAPRRISDRLSYALFDVCCNPPFNQPFQCFEEIDFSVLQIEIFLHWDNTVCPFHIVNHTYTNDTVEYDLSEAQFVAFYEQHILSNSEGKNLIHANHQYDWNEIFSNKYLSLTSNIEDIAAIGRTDAYFEYYSFREIYEYHYHRQSKAINIDRFAPYRSAQYIEDNRQMADKEQAELGLEVCQYFKNYGWKPVKTITTLVSSYTKLNRFLCTKYQTCINNVQDLLYSGENNFNFPKFADSCLGICVEYFAKGELYRDYLEPCIANARRETVNGVLNDRALKIRACMNMYRDMMKRIYGFDKCKTISYDQLCKDEYQQFCSTIENLGLRTGQALHVLLNVPQGKHIIQQYSPDMCTSFLNGLVDVISYDTIIDIKVTSCITPKMILQVLGYHYLSTKRSDVSIDRVVVYEAVKDRAVVIEGLRDMKDVRAYRIDDVSKREVESKDE